MRGGMGTLGTALSNAASDLGAVIRYDASVASIDKTHDRVTGVTLNSGEQLTAKLIVSSADPKTTFKSLLGYQHMEAGLVRRI